MSSGKLEKGRKARNGRGGGAEIAEAIGKFGDEAKRGRGFLVANVQGGFPAMNTSARQSVVVPEQGQRKTCSNGERRTNNGIDEIAAQPKPEGWAGGKPRVFVAAENRLLHEALSRMLAKGGNIEVAGASRAGPLRTEDLLKEEADILLLTSRGSVNEDLSAIRKVRASAPKVQILLIGVSEEETEFLQCVRAGVRGYLPKALQQRTWWKGCERCRPGRRFVPAHSARCFSSISRGRQLRFLPRACTSGWD